MRKGPVVRHRAFFMRVTTGADYTRAWLAARMRVTPDTLNGMLSSVRLVKPSESDALLGQPRPRLMTTAARIQSTLIEAGLMSGPLRLEPLFRWPIGVEQSACRG